MLYFTSFISSYELLISNHLIIIVIIMLYIIVNYFWILGMDLYYYC